MRITQKQIIAIVIAMLELLALLSIVLIHRGLSLTQMAELSIVQVVYNTLLLKYFCKMPFVSLPSGFLILSFIFHCGQIIKSAFDIDGFVPMSFENYASTLIIQDAFLFYCLAQTMYVIGIILHSNDSKYYNTDVIAEEEKETWKYGKVFLLIGIGPRLYIDVSSMLGALAQGYEGVYSLYFPQFLQTLAFFFDAGLIFLLVGTKAYSKQHKFVFILTIIYKSIMMMSGSRQYNVVFLLVWVYLYAYILHKVTFKKQILAFSIGFLGFVFISMIGMFRSSNVVSVADMSYFIEQFSLETILGNALGEYGSAFNTLIVSVNYTPDTIYYGLGRSYVAGFFSVIPLLVAQIPSLHEAAIFLTQLPKSIVYSFGGSYLGELYYNFSWLGIFPCIYLGIWLCKINNALLYNDDVMKKSWYAIIGVLLILFIRGYFSDMMQKIAWVYIILYWLRINKKVKFRI